MNYSKQREVVYNYVNNCHCHPSADKVYEEVKKILPNISFSTVYRNLNILVEQKLIRKISLDGEKYIYDDIDRKHFHFYCNKCSKIEDIILADNILKKMCHEINYEINSIEIVVKGICNKCKEG